MGLVCGVDGCKSGWLVLMRDTTTGNITSRICSRAREFLSMIPKPDVLAMDIPIGLTVKGPRSCDIVARKMLGTKRSSSVFPAPIRSVLDADDYWDACNTRFIIEGKKISKQLWAILPKIREVDTLMRNDSSRMNWIREVHPEICFYHLNGKRPIIEGKRTEEGMKMRQRLLETIFGDWVHILLSNGRNLPCAKDDILDAFAALWTAERIAAEKHETIPDQPEIDSYGLKMEMVA